MAKSNKIIVCLRCSVSAPNFARSLCSACYQHLRRHRLPLPPKVRLNFSEYWAAMPKPEIGCWAWPGFVDDEGYGRGFASREESQYTHIIAFERENGPVPKGLTLDHACHSESLGCLGGDTCLHRRCCRPSHLEPLTIWENVQRSPFSISALNALKTECHNKHAFTEQNTYVFRGMRTCRQCRRDRGVGYAKR